MYKVKTYEIHVHVNATIRVKVFGEISFHAMAENWQRLKDTLAFLSFLVTCSQNSDNARDNSALLF